MRNDTKWSIIGCNGKVFAGKIQNDPDPIPASAAVMVWSCFEIVDVRQASDISPELAAYLVVLQSSACLRLVAPRVSL